ncbi:hypothetical protein [Streptomyces sp. CB01881]|uniref:hypothetical protein n=1 Tax=Streptomyces sp. CB01881 TaxID=2078691 RepID=UPI000CDBA72E|nr:hypothetical protein [Streptomyces sp. CB01881]AUY52769.1 hypothetical protein C2142_31975 [Streptomyces sp. CB01881]TYC70487.1 hypothetical protein EH183_32040 [Streptomyces sp. CB01881]
MHATRTQPTTKLHGYGVRWDPAARAYRVRNEMTGEWLLDSSGRLAGFSSFSAAEAAYRAFEPRRRAV